MVDVRKSRQYIGPLLLIIGALFLASFFANNLDAVHAAINSSQENTAVFLLAFGIILVMLPIHAFKWALVNRFMGVDVAYLTLFRLFTYYQVSSFIPGLIPQFVSLDQYGKKVGLDSRQTISSLMINTFIGVLAANILLLTYLFLRNIQLDIIGTHWLLVSIGLLLVLTHPCVIRFGLAFISRLLNKDPVAFTLTYRHTLIVALAALLSWTISGSGFYFLLKGLGFGVPWFDAVATYAGAWAIGFMALIVPGGLGIREGVIVYLLQGTIGVEQAVVAATVARVWATFPQAFYFVIVAGYNLLKERSALVS